MRDAYSANPYADFARVLEIFFPPYRPAPGIESARFDRADATLGANAFDRRVGSDRAGVSTGGRSVHPNVTIYPGVRIGDRFTAHSGVSIREGTVIGNRVTLLNGAVSGRRGFDSSGERRLDQNSTSRDVIIEDDVEIGANSTVDRAMMGATVLHRGVKLDDQVHIGHNCEIGEYSRFSGHTGISGSTRIGKWCLFGGQVGCADHVTIGDRVMVVAKAGIHTDLKDDAVVSGIPAVDVRKFRRYAVVLTRLPE